MQKCKSENRAVEPCFSHIGSYMGASDPEAGPGSREEGEAPQRMWGCVTSWLSSCGTLAGTVQVGETVAVGVLVRAVRDAGRDRVLALTRLMLGSGTASGGPRGRGRVCVSLPKSHGSLAYLSGSFETSVSGNANGPPCSLKYSLRNSSCLSAAVCFSKA